LARHGNELFPIERFGRKIPDNLLDAVRTDADDDAPSARLFHHRAGRLSRARNHCAMPPERAFCPRKYVAGMCGDFQPPSC
jgi:hypothetical protein